MTTRSQYKKSWPYRKAARVEQQVKVNALMKSAAKYHTNDTGLRSSKFHAKTWIQLANDPEFTDQDRKVHTAYAKEMVKEVTKHKKLDSAYRGDVVRDVVSLMPYRNPLV